MIQPLQPAHCSPRAGIFTNFGPCCIYPCLTQWLVGVSAQRFCRMRGGACPGLFCICLHLWTNPFLTWFEMEGSLSLIPAPFSAPTWCFKLDGHTQGWEGVVQSWTPCLLTRHGIRGSDAQLSCLLSCMMGLVYRVWEMTLWLGEEPEFHKTQSIALLCTPDPVGLQARLHANLWLCDCLGLVDL